MLLHVVASLALNRGGPSRSVVALARAQGRLGCGVALATMEDPAEDARPVPELPVRWARADRPLRIGRSRELARFLRTEPAEVIHHHALWLRTLHYAHNTARRRGVPLVISPRGMMSSWSWRHHRGRKRLASLFLHPGALRGAAGWHATSAAEAEDIRRLGFKQPICTAPNGVDLPNEEQLTIAREHWFERVPSARTKRIALFHSRFHSKKRVIELIDLWVALAPPDWQLLLVGIPDQFSVEQLSGYVFRALARDRVLVFDGTCQPPPYAIASLFLLPSHSENFGLAIAEALAARVPTLVTDATPWGELNEIGGGWCVPWETYAATLRSALAEDPVALAARGQTARDWVGRNFSWERSAAALLAFYSSLARVR